MKFIYRIPYAIVQWIVMANIKAPLFLIGLPAVAFSVVGDGLYRTPKMWRFWADAENLRPGVERTRWALWWEFAIRNPVRGLKIDGPSEYETYGTDSLETVDGFAWRYRHSRWLDSFRMVWGSPRPQKGKREFYIGWKIGSTSPCKFTVQLRPF